MIPNPTKSTNTVRKRIDSRTQGARPDPGPEGTSSARIVVPPLGLPVSALQAVRGGVSFF